MLNDGERRERLRRYGNVLGTKVLLGFELETVGVDAESVRSSQRPFILERPEVRGNDADNGLEGRNREMAVAPPAPTYPATEMEKHHHMLTITGIVPHTMPCCGYTGKLNTAHSVRAA